MLLGSFWKLAWNGGHRELLTEPTVCASKRCLDDPFPSEPPTDIWNNIGNTGKYFLKSTHTFENNSILGTPQVSERLQGLADHNIYRFRFISENIELAGVSKIFGRINLDSVLICLW